MSKTLAKIERDLMRVDHAIEKTRAEIDAKQSAMSELERERRAYLAAAMALRGEPA